MTRAFALHLRRHVVGYLALTLALGGGGAYAAGTLERITPTVDSPA